MMLLAVKMLHREITLLTQQTPKNITNLSADLKTENITIESYERRKLTEKNKYVPQSMQLTLFPFRPFIRSLRQKTRALCSDVVDC